MTMYSAPQKSIADKHACVMSVQSHIAKTNFTKFSVHFTECISKEGTAIGSVHLSVCLSLLS